MKSPPVRLGSCRKVKDCLTRELSLVIGVMDARGRLQETVYAVRLGEQPGTVELVKDDGEVTTLEPGGRCSCADARYRKRPGGECKHLRAARLAGLLGPAFRKEARAVINRHLGGRGPTPLDLLRRAWGLASTAERQAFLKEVNG